MSTNTEVLCLSQFTKRCIKIRQNAEKVGRNPVNIDKRRNLWENIIYKSIRKGSLDEDKKAYYSRHIIGGIHIMFRVSAGCGGCRKSFHLGRQLCSCKRTELIHKRLCYSWRQFHRTRRHFANGAVRRKHNYSPWNGAHSKGKYRYRKRCFAYNIGHTEPWQRFFALHRRNTFFGLGLCTQRFWQSIAVGYFADGADGSFDYKFRLWLLRKIVAVGHGNN